MNEYIESCIQHVLCKGTLEMVLSLTYETGFEVWVLYVALEFDDNNSIWVVMWIQDCSLISWWGQMKPSFKIHFLRRNIKLGDKK